MYKDVVQFVETCVVCQQYSIVRHRDGLHPTYPLALHYKWVVDLITMPMGVWQVCYIVLTREDLSSQVEGRALRTKATSAVCRFLLEDVICRYGCVGKITTDRGELDAEEAQEFFARIGVKLSLTMAYNPEGNGKSERGHPPIVKALAKSCQGRIANWPKLLPYALWADRTTHSSVTGFMPFELMYGQKPIMPTEEAITTWSILPWEMNISREDLLALRIRQLERHKEDVEQAKIKLKDARVKNKAAFDQKHRLRPIALQDGDWVLVYDSSLDNQYTTMRKMVRRWFGPYVVMQVLDHGAYKLCELDGTVLKVPIAGKRVKLFKRRDGQFALEDTGIDEASEEDTGSMSDDESDPILDEEI